LAVAAALALFEAHTALATPPATPPAAPRALSIIGINANKGITPPYFFYIIETISLTFFICEYDSVRFTPVFALLS